MSNADECAAYRQVFTLVRGLLDEARYDEVIKASDLALVHLPLHVGILTLKGVALLKLGRPREAVSALLRAHLLSPTDGDIRRYVARAYGASGDLDGAKAFCANYPEIDFREVEHEYEHRTGRSAQVAASLASAKQYDSTRTGILARRALLASRYRGASAVVTGGAGFIGSHLCDALERAGARVTVIDVRPVTEWQNLSGSKAARIVADVREREVWRALFRSNRPEFVFHLAANASVPRSAEEPVYDFENNTVATLAVLDAVRELGQPMPRVFFASSAAVYGEPGGAPVDESAPLKPVSPYGVSKLCAEELCRLYARLYNVPVVIGRLCNTYGPRVPRFVMLDFLEKLGRDPKKLEILGDGKQIRDFSFVSDTVAGIMAVMLQGENGQAYNIASGASHSVTDLAKNLTQILELPDVEFSYSGTSWQGDAQQWRFNIAKVRKRAHEPVVSMNEGLTHLVEWYREGRR